MGKKIQCIGRYVMDGLTLGKGNFARVELATHGITGCKVAIKIIDTRKIKEDYIRANLHREARILGQIRHPNIIRLYETLKATTLYCLVLEYASGGDLLAFIKSQKEACLQETKAQPYFRQLISAIHFLHERGVAHRDLKMENILLDEKHKNVKVIDFGLSNTYTRGELMKTHCGSLEYAAPELIASTDKYGPEVDIWSLGIVLYGMVVGKLPFSTHYTDQYRRQKLQTQIEKGLTEIHLKEMIAHTLSQDLIELLKKLVEPSVESRLPLMDCEIHPWVTSTNKLPFCPFQSLPKDKTSKSQVIDDLTALLETPREQVEKTVHENKCDDFSAMFNMMLDCKRTDKGLFDIDYTVKQDTKKDRHHKKKHHHRASSRTKQSRFSENVKHNNVSKDQTHFHYNGSRPESPEPFNIPFSLWEEFVKATPAILCHDAGGHSDHEGEHKPPLHQSHNSTNFDLMALCSNPTWLGGDKRKTKRNKKTPLPPTSPLVLADGTKVDQSEDAASATLAGSSHDHSNLLSPTQASSQVAALLRRNSSRRRPRRTSSAEPPSRHGSTNSSRRLRRQRPGTPGSDPHSPHSPSNLNNPEIKIITPKQSPIPTVKRPANLVGLNQCYANSEDTNTSNSKGLCRKSTLGPGNSYSRRRRNRNGRERTESTHSDSSNACSISNLNHDDTSDGSQEMIPPPVSRPDSRASCCSHEDLIDNSVESKIAATDIRSIVRPKRFVIKGKVNGPSKNCKGDKVFSSLEVPTKEDSTYRSLASSPEIIIETMQPNTYANLSDDEKIENIERQIICEIPKTDSEKRVEQEKTTDFLIPNHLSSSENLQSSTELLGAASIKPSSNINDKLLCESKSLHEMCGSDLYANVNDMVDSYIQPCRAVNNDQFSEEGGSKRLIADLYSKKEKISLNERIVLQDDICFLDSSDHNSSQENLFRDTSGRRRGIKESLTSDENESMSAPILISPRELGLKLNHGDGYGESPIRPGLSSVLSSRHGSSPSVRFVMPSTPIRQMFKTPIARIDSFHSDDFEAYTSDIDGLVLSPSPSPSPNSIQTPTVACFQYKINPRRKKHLFQKPSKNHRKLMRDGVPYARDGVMTFLPEKSSGVDVRPNDPLFSSSSECGSDGQVPEVEKPLHASKAKIFPMEKDEDQSDVKATKMTAHLNDKTKLISENTVNQNNTKKQQNSICKSFLSKQTQQESEPKKSSWRRGFAHLLKKKKLSSFNGGNNNNDVHSPTKNRTGNHRSNYNSANNNRSTTRNGHARGSIPVSPPGRNNGTNGTNNGGTNNDIPATNVEIQWLPPQNLQNNIKTINNSDPADTNYSPAPSPSPTKTKVYDLTIVSPEATTKSKPCLLSWKSCRECTFSDDHSSSEGSEGNVCNSAIADHVDINSSIPITTYQSTSFTACNTASS